MCAACWKDNDNIGTDIKFSYADNGACGGVCLSGYNGIHCQVAVGPMQWIIQKDSNHFLNQQEKFPNTTFGLGPIRPVCTSDISTNAHCDGN